MFQLRSVPALVEVTFWDGGWGAQTTDKKQGGELQCRLSDALGGGVARKGFLVCVTLQVTPEGQEHYRACATL